ncbi:MAG: hypothetical protein IJ723_07255 [Ruminococcus sp.]|nr:hypothetical protein [Ruminococcus sp.]
MKMKKIMCLLAALTMAMTTLPAAAYAEPADTLETDDSIAEIDCGLTFGLTDENATVTGCTGCGDEIVIPAEFNGRPVTGIAAGALKEVTAKSITVPQSVVSIGEDCLPADGSVLIKCCLGSAAGEYCEEQVVLYDDMEFTYIDLTDLKDTTFSRPGRPEAYPAEVKTYDGSEQTINYIDRLYNGTVLLTEGTDYVVSYRNNVNAGKATKVFTGAGSYTGEATYDFYIAEATLQGEYVSMKSDRYAYTGKTRKPAVTVTFGGKKLKKNVDYSVSYKNSKLPGKATVTVTGKGNFIGKVSKTFYIVPKKAEVAKKKAPGGGKVKVWVKKDSKASGYEIELSTNKKFTAKSTVRARLGSNTKTAKTFTGLKKGKVYYIRARSYVKVGSKNYFGSCSKLTKIKCK